MSRRRDDHRIAVWCGEYEFGLDDSFYRALVSVARKFADKRPDARPPEALFRDELESLRRVAPSDAQGLLDQLEHRWQHPDCPASLYVVTCTLRAPHGGYLVSEDGAHVQELACTKVAQAEHCVAARIARYKTEPLHGLTIAKGSQTLRAVIY